MISPLLTTPDVPRDADDDAVSLRTRYLFRRAASRPRAATRLAGDRGKLGREAGVFARCRRTCACLPLTSASILKPFDTPCGLHASAALPQAPFRRRTYLTPVGSFADELQPFSISAVLTPFIGIDC